jgi:hypothetical protein
MLPTNSFRKPLVITVFVCYMFCEVINGAAQNTYLPATNNSSSNVSACLPKGGPTPGSSNAKATSAPQEPTVRVVGEPLTSANQDPASSETVQGAANRNNDGLKVGAVDTDAPSHDPLTTKLDFDKVATPPLQCRPEEKKESSSSLKAAGAAPVH